MTNLKLLSWNVNGIRARYNNNQLQQIFSEKPDILCLQEVKAHPEQIPSKLLELDDYHFYLNHNTTHSYTGVGIFTKEEPLNVEMSFQNFEEGRVLKAEFNEFTLYNIYFPDGTGPSEKLEYKLNFYNKFLSSVQNESKTIICGDFNIAHQTSDIHNPQQAKRSVGFLPEEREKLDQLLSAGFIDSFRLFNPDPHNYTWWSYSHNNRAKNRGMRLDYFFTSNDLKENIKDAKIRSDIIGSDHCPIELII